MKYESLVWILNLNTLYVTDDKDSRVHLTLQNYFQDS